MIKFLKNKYNFQWILRNKTQFYLIFIRRHNFFFSCQSHCRLWATNRKQHRIEKHTNNAERTHLYRWRTFQSQPNGACIELFFCKQCMPCLVYIHEVFVVLYRFWTEHFYLKDRIISIERNFFEKIYFHQMLRLNFLNFSSNFQNKKRKNFVNLETATSIDNICIS